MVGGMFTVDIDKSRTIDLCHSGTTEDSIDVASMHGDFGTAARITGITSTIDVTANGNLRKDIEH